MGCVSGLVGCKARASAFSARPVAGRIPGWSTAAERSAGESDRSKAVQSACTLLQQIRRMCLPRRSQDAKTEHHLPTRRSTLGCVLSITRLLMGKSTCPDFSPVLSHGREFCQERRDPAVLPAYFGGRQECCAALPESSVRPPGHRPSWEVRSTRPCWRKGVSSFRCRASRPRRGPRSLARSEGGATRRAHARQGTRAGEEEQDSN